MSADNGASAGLDEIIALEKSVRKQMEAGNIEDASVILAKATEMYRKLPEDEKPRTDKSFRSLPFELAEKYRATADQEDAAESALRWYEVYCELQFEAKKHPKMSRITPYFYYQQRPYSYVLAMAMAECGNDPSKVKKRYPNLARSWAPFLIGDLDGDGNLEIVSDNAEPYGNDRSMIRVFCFDRLDEKGAPVTYTYEDEYHFPFMSLSDVDGDRKEEIVLRNYPRSRCLGFDKSKDPAEVMFKWYQLTIVIVFDGKRIYKGDQSVQTWDEEPKDFPK